MSETFVPVILAGGKGERFWPLSRRQRPKQFLSLDGSGKSLLQATADRLLSLSNGWENLWVITSDSLAEGVRQQLSDLQQANLLVEPEGKDTGPAVAWASLAISRHYHGDPVIGFFPADHWIGEEEIFHDTIRAACEFARGQDAIVTLGIKPTFPSTGYGYIEQGEEKANIANFPVYQVNRFTEKPDRSTAEKFMAAEKYSWNSGMFVFRTGVVLEELARHAGDILEPLQTRGKEAYPSLRKISIDYALMEKTELAYTIPADFGWDDLGDWNALARLLKKDRKNIVIGNHLGKDTQDAIIYNSNPDEVIVTIGLDDVVIVRDNNATLVVNKNRTQEIKEILKELANNPQTQEFL